MKKNLPLLVLLFITQMLSSQTLLQKWASQTNNAAITNSDDVPKFTIVDNAGKVAILGESNGKVILVAYDQNGNDLWTNKYNAAYTDYALGLERDNAGNYYAGYFWGGTIRKINSSGISQWTQPSSAYHGRCFTIDKTTGITYAVGTDYATSTVYIDKIGISGNITWTKTYTGYYGLGAYPKKISFDGSGKLILALNVRDSSGNLHPSLAKFDNSGNPVWQYAYKTLTGELNDLLVDTVTNASYVTGFFNNGSNQADMYMLKVGSAGSYNWADVFHDAGINGDDKGCSITRDNTGNLYTAVLSSSGANFKYNIRKYSISGSVLASNGIATAYYNANVPDPKINFNKTNNKVYLSGTYASSGINNGMALYSSNSGLSSVNQIYLYNYVGTGNDYGVDIDFDPSGNPVFTGNIYSALNGNDYHYAKTDTLGAFIYSNTCNGVINGADEAADIITDNSNYPVVAGSTKSTLTNYDGALVKYDAVGNEQFLMAYNGPDSLDDKFIAIDTTSSGHYYAAGYVGRKNAANWMPQQNDMWLVKTDPNGTLLWQLVLAGTAAYGKDEVKDILTDNFNNIFVTGIQTNSGTGQDAVLMKVNPSGNILWTKKFSGSGNNKDAFYSLVKTGNGPFYAAGYTTNANGNKDVLVCRYDAAGNLAWSASWNSPQNGNDSALAVAIDGSDNAYVSCLSDSAKVVTIKFNANGSLAWATAEYGMANVGSSIRVNNLNGQVYISCRRDSSIWDYVNVICYNNAGVKKWTKEYDYTCCEEPMKLRKTSRGTIIALFDLYYRIGVIELDTLGNELNKVLYSTSLGNSDGGARAMTIDKNDDVYATGYFKEETGSDIYTLKLCYAPAPVTILGNTNVCSHASAVPYGVLPNSSISNYSWTSTNGLTINPADVVSAILVDVNNASSGYLILQQTNSCGIGQPDSLHINVLPLPAVSGGSNKTACPNSSITLSGAGAQNYSWSGGITNNTPFTITSSMAYIVTGTDANGCSNKDTVLVIIKQAPFVELCAVTVDTLSTHNILAWDKSNLTSEVDYFNIYREDITNNYTLIGAVSFDSLSEYHDHGADPNITTKRYKISAVDTCGNEGPKSPFHNTIFISNNSGSFSWNTYSIQNLPNPVQFYALYRDDNSTGNWHQLNTTAGTQNILNDPSFTSFPNGRWRIETIWNIACHPTRGAINTSRSNIKTASFTIGELEANNQVSILAQPNPFSNSIVFNVTGTNEKNYTLEVYDALGKLVLATNSSQTRTELNAEGLSSGIYYYKVYNNNLNKTGKIIKQ